MTLFDRKPVFCGIPTFVVAAKFCAVVDKFGEKPWKAVATAVAGAVTDVFERSNMPKRFIGDGGAGEL